MEQLQSLLANIATGLQRLEREEATVAEATANSAASTTPKPSQAAERARKATLRIATAANRSSWCSSCELASFLRTGAHCRKTHRPVQVFLSRPLYLFEECRRLLQQAHKQLIAAPSFADDTFRPIDVLQFDVTRALATQPVAACDSDVQLAPAPPDGAVQPVAQPPYHHTAVAEATADEPQGAPSDDLVEDGAASDSREEQRPEALG